VLTINALLLHLETFKPQETHFSRDTPRYTYISKKHINQETSMHLEEHIYIETHILETKAHTRRHMYLRNTYA